jgi:hypothetical protein
VGASGSRRVCLVGSMKWDEEGWDEVIPFFMMFSSVSKGWDMEYSIQMLDKLITENLVDELILLC